MGRTPHSRRICFGASLWQEGRYDPAKQDPFSNYITESGDNPNAFNTSLSLFAQYDTRDVTFNASRGIFIKAEATWYPEWLGNTRRNFGRFLRRLPSLPVLSNVSG